MDDCIIWRFFGFWYFLHEFPISSMFSLHDLMDLSWSSTNLVISKFSYLCFFFGYLRGSSDHRYVSFDRALDRSRGDAYSYGTIFTGAGAGVLGRKSRRYLLRATTLKIFL